MNELNDLYSEFMDEEYAHAYMEASLDSSIATQIKVLREQRGWSQKELAERAGMQQPRLSTMENVNYGSWSINTLRRLARAFDLRLKVSFETFSSGIHEINAFGRTSLQRESREKDLRRLLQPVDNEKVVDFMERLNRQDEEKAKGLNAKSADKESAAGKAAISGQDTKDSDKDSDAESAYRQSDFRPRAIA